MSARKEFKLSSIKKEIEWKKHSVLEVVDGLVEQLERRLNLIFSSCDDREASRQTRMALEETTQASRSIHDEFEKMVFRVLTDRVKMSKEVQL